MTSPENPAASRSVAAIKSRVARGGVAMGVSTVARSLLEFSATLVTARVLTPKDFGLVGMVLAIIGFVDMFKDLGLATVTVQRENLSEEQKAGLFWLTVAVGAGLALLTAAAAPLISWGYGQPVLTEITLVLSSCLFLNALSVQHQALLRRELKFERLTIVQTVGTLAGVVTVITGALCGLGPWALVLKQLAGPIASGCCAWFLLRWVPGSPRGAGLGELLRMGAHVTGFQVANYVERNLDNALIGKFAGAQQLGCYVRAYDLLRLPLQQVGEPIGTVAVPTLSRLASDPARYRDGYLRMTRALLLLTIPLTPFLVICADWLVALAFGPQWTAAVPIFRYLGLALLLKPLGYSIGWLFVSQGRTHELMRWGFWASALAIASFVVGLPWGAGGVALSYTLVDLVVRMPILVYWVGRSGPVSVADLLKLPITAWVCAGCSAILLLGMRSTVGTTLGAGLGSLLAALITLSTTSLVIWASPVGRRSVLDLWLLLRHKKTV